MIFKVTCDFIRDCARVESFVTITISNILTVNKRCLSIIQSFHFFSVNAMDFCSLRSVQISLVFKRNVFQDYRILLVTPLGVESSNYTVTDTIVLSGTGCLSSVDHFGWFCDFSLKIFVIFELSCLPQNSHRMREERVTGASHAAIPKTTTSIPSQCLEERAFANCCLWTGIYIEYNPFGLHLHRV